MIDHSTSGDYFLVYTAFPKIAKYNPDGTELWETGPIRTPAIDSIKSHFFSWMKQHSGSRISLSYYLSGVSSPDGDLYLVMNKSNPVIIHQFNATGKLVHIYKLLSKEVDLAPIFAIDFQRHGIFIVTELGEVRIYSF